MPLKRARLHSARDCFDESPRKAIFGFNNLDFHARSVQLRDSASEK